MLKRFIDFCIDRRASVVWTISTLSVLMLFCASQVQVGTNFTDLLPTGHPYIAIHNQFKATFGSSNAVTIVMEVNDGDIFRTDFLERLQRATFALRKVDGVNSAQIVSLASGKLKDVRTSSEGWETTPLMFPDVPSDRGALDTLRERVLKSGLVYGTYLSRDLKAALISVDFYEHLLKPATAFPQIRAVMEQVKAPWIRVRMVGEPVLAGWVAYHLPETLLILAATVCVLGALLFFVTRSWRGTLLPGLAGLMSGAWALGFAAILRIGIDPLVIVIAFLITARAISHSVQLVTRFDDEIRAGAKTAREAAKAAMLSLFKPGMLGVIADAGCILVVLLVPIPLLKKIAIIGTVWMLTIALSAVVMTPVLLSWVKLPVRYAHSINVLPLLERLLSAIADMVSGRARYGLAGAAAIIFVLSGWHAFNLTVGDATAGSPLLHRDSEYNVDAAEINRLFSGADKMFVVLSGTSEDDIKRPEALRAMLRFQKYMEAQPEVGASLSIADLLPSVKRTLRDGNHRYEELGRTQIENGELLYMLASGADASDMERFADRPFRSAPVTLFFRDHQGETVRNAVARIKAFIETDGVEGFTFLLAGGSVGVIAAVNEVIFAGLIESIALALLVLALCCAVAYRSLAAGTFFMVPVVLANTVTFSFMAWQGIGMNIHTLPVAALGIALGVDYSFYVIDAIREELRKGAALRDAIRSALNGAGKGVLITAGTLILSLAVWAWSSLRFQSEMALLMAIWLLVSAASALLLMPALVVIFKPRFVSRKSGHKGD